MELAQSPTTESQKPQVEDKRYVLTEKQREVLVQRARGLKDKEIALRLEKSVNTVKTQLDGIANANENTSSHEIVIDMLRSGDMKPDEVVNMRILDYFQNMPLSDKMRSILDELIEPGSNVKYMRENGKIADSLDINPRRIVKAISTLYDKMRKYAQNDPSGKPLMLNKTSLGVNYFVFKHPELLKHPLQATPLKAPEVAIAA